MNGVEAPHFWLRELLGGIKSIKVFSWREAMPWWVGGGQSLVLSEACSVRVLMWNVTRTNKKKKKKSQKWKIEIGDSLIAPIRKKRTTKKGKRVVDGFLLLCNFKHGRNNNEGEG